jgi:hypothetical protein
MWFVNNQLHRANGPAVRWSNSEQEWWWYGQEVDEFEHMMRMTPEMAND